MADPVTKEQVEIATKLASLMDRMAAATGKIDSSQTMQVESMKELAAVMSQFDMRAVIGELNEVSQNVKQVVEKLSELNKTQQETFEEMSKKSEAANNKVKALTGGLAGAKEGVANINKSPMDEFIANIEKSGGVTKMFQTKIVDLVGIFKNKFPKGAMMAGAAVTGMIQGFKNLMAIGKGLTGFLTTAVEGIGAIGMAILAIPFKMFNGLIDIANKASGGSNELLQAIEDLRKEFGALGTGSPKVIMQMSTELKGFSDTGLGAFQVFGTLTERLQAFLKLAQSMGPTFQNFGEEFRSNGGAILAWQKGLGLSDEMMKTIGQTAKAMGKSMSSVLLPIQKQAQDLGKAFGIDSKLISRDMVKAMADLKHFAGASVKEIASASVYARKLGLELHDITGTLDAFDTFDSAADNASKLSQAFGLNIDAFKLMEAQDPATQIEMLRKSFASAGQDASKFNRQQLQLLASSTGLSEEQAKLAFSMKNQGVGLDDIKKKSEGAEKKQLSQAEAMKALADSIERMVKSGGAQSGGFFERFFKGIMGGLQSSHEFRKIIMNIQRALMLTEMAGVKLGRALAQLAPVKELLGDIASIFSPKKFATLFGGISKEIEKFAKGEEQFTGMMDMIKIHFLDFFDSEKGPGKKILAGFGKFFEYIVKAISDALPAMATKLSGFMTDLTKFILDPKAASDAAAKGGGVAATVVAIIKPLGNALATSWNIISPSLLEFVDVAITKIGELMSMALKNEKFMGIVKKALFGSFAIVFGPAVFRMALSGIISNFGGELAKIIPKIFGSSAVKAGATEGVEAMGGTLSKAMGGLGKFIGPVAIIAAITGASIGISKGIKKYQEGLEEEFGKAESKIGAAAGGIVEAITFGLLPDGITDEIATAVAEISESIFKATEKLLGPSLNERLKKYIMSGIDVFGAIGDLITAIFSGKEGDIANQLINVGSKIVGYVGSWFALLIEAVPTYSLRLIEFATLLVGKFWGVIGELIEKGADLPVIGPFFHVLAEAVKLWGRTMTVVSDLVGKLGEKLREIGIVTIFEKVGKVIGVVFGALQSLIAPVKFIAAFLTAPLWLPMVAGWKLLALTIDNFTTIVDTVVKDVSFKMNLFKAIFSTIASWFVKNVHEPLASTFRKIVGTISDVVGEAWKAVTDTFDVASVKAVFMNVVNGIKSALSEILNIPVFTDLISVAKKALKIKSPSKVFEDIGDNVTAGFSKGIEDMPKTMSEKMKETVEAAKTESAGSSVTTAGANVAKQAPKQVTQPGSAWSVTNSVEAMSKEASQKMAEIARVTDDAAAQAQIIVDNIEKGGLKQALLAISEMASKANELNESLGRLPGIKLDAKLKTLANSMGIGGKFNYQIKNPGVEINIAMNVNINAADMEKALVLRDKSIIRERLNFATGNGTAGKEASPPLPNNTSSPTGPLQVVGG